MLKDELRTERIDFRIPPGYRVVLIETITSPDRYEAHEGPQRKLGDFEFSSDAVEACIEDARSRGWLKSRYQRIAEGGEEPPPAHAEGCCRCGKLVEEDGTKVGWDCQACYRLVCRDCTLVIPGERTYYFMTLCSHACWVKAGKPSE